MKTIISDLLESAHIVATGHYRHELRTPELSDDSGSDCSRESSPRTAPIPILDPIPSIRSEDSLVHIPSGDYKIIEVVHPDVIDPMKRKHHLNTRTDEACAKRVRTSGTLSDTSKVMDDLLMCDRTNVRVVESDVVSVHNERDSPLQSIPRPPKRKWCPGTDTLKVRAKRVRTPSTSSDAFKVKDGVPFGPHPRCMITGCVSPEVEPCYILPPDMPQQLVSG